MHHTLATRIVPSRTRAPRSGTSAASITQERQGHAQERDTGAWAFTWALLTHAELPDVPDELSTPHRMRPHGNGAPQC